MLIVEFVAFSNPAFNCGLSLHESVPDVLLDRKLPVESAGPAVGRVYVTPAVAAPACKIVAYVDDAL
jgi:hypothetical protein